MSRVCKLTGKRPLRGNRVSKSNIKTNRFQYPNLQKKKIFIPELNKSVTIKLSVKAMKIVDKLGLLPYLKKQGLTLADVSWVYNMKKEIHPDDYRLVAFQDTSCDYSFLTRSTVQTSDTIEWEDGKEYPLYKLEISDRSHPYFTGKQNLVDSAGRIEKFNRKYKISTDEVIETSEETPASEEVPTDEVVETAEAASESEKVPAKEKKN